MRRYLAIIGPDHTWQERRSLAIALAMQAEIRDPDLPDRGPCIGRVFMTTVTLHLPGWPRSIKLFGFVPKSIGGEAGKIPSWDSLNAHFERKEKRQNRVMF